MKILFKTLAILVASGGGIGLGFFVNYILNSNKFTFAICLICAIVALFAGGFLLIAAFIYLWEKGSEEKVFYDEAPAADNETDSE